MAAPGAAIVNPEAASVVAKGHENGRVSAPVERASVYALA